VTGIEGYRKRLAVDVPEHWCRTIVLDDLQGIQRIDETVAAVLVESVPSLAGVQLPSPAWLAAVQQRCLEVGALFVFDEVQGGVGRLGRWFGHEALGVTPDIVTLAKSLGGGFPVGAMVTTPAIADWIGFGELGTTFGGGPMACAMVEAVHRIIVRDGLMERVGVLFEQVSSALGPLDGVQVRGRGALIGIQTALPAKELRRRLLEHDILVGVSGHAHTARLLLPYVVSDDELQRLFDVFPEVLP
jgi:acetylornithine/succinyldiaminopimelate/putrescine aminotransferase